ncbi:MAG TPA: hypothetical protein PKZ00_09400, partial [Elusimicrobiota bacterium]|nr:hypothetical protein [Elusimicrobiota bacterium]
FNPEIPAGFMETLEGRHGPPQGRGADAAALEDAFPKTDGEAFPVKASGEAVRADVVDIEPNGVGS